MSFKSSFPRGVALLCAALVGAMWVPAPANAASGSQKWAVVSAKGKLVRSNGATRASRVSKGRYLVEFNTSMAKCAFEVTQGDPAVGLFEGPVAVTVGQPAGQPKELFVQTFLAFSKVVLSDLAFHVTTYCGTSASDAVVKSDGSTARASRLVSSTRTGDGVYALVFDHDVHTCAYTATIGSAIPGEVLTPGAISVDPFPGQIDGVVVQTMAPSGADTDFPFHLAVNCDPKRLFAVVNADGTAVLGSHVVSSSKPFPGLVGLYEVIFDRKVTACAYTATVAGLPAPGGVGAPTTVTTASRDGNANGVILSLDDRLSGSVDAPFHLVVTC